MRSIAIASIVTCLGASAVAAQTPRIGAPVAIPSGEIAVPSVPAAPPASTIPGASYAKPAALLAPAVPLRAAAVPAAAPPVAHAPSAPHVPQLSVPSQVVEAAPTVPGSIPVQMALPASSRWGDAIGGRWRGGANAPGGWKAYRTPRHGRVLPRYWLSSDFALRDYASWGLPIPPYGYGWSRYYDDAVLIDWRGTVLDHVSGIDWSRPGYGGYYGGSTQDAGYYAQPGYGGCQTTPEPQVHVEGDATVHVTHNGTPGSSGYGCGGSYGYAAGYAPGCACGGGYYYPAPVVTTITIEPRPAVATTTVRYVTEKHWVGGGVRYRTIRPAKVQTKVRPVQTKQAKPAAPVKQAKGK